MPKIDLMKIKPWLNTAVLSSVLLLGANKVMSQNGQPGGGNFAGGNFDPAQIQKMIMDRFREQLEVKDDAEWKIIEERIQKVNDARREVGSGGMGMLGGLMRRGGGNGGQGGGGRRGFGAFAPTPLPEEEALQKAVDAKASNEELKTAMAKLLAARKAKQAALEQAQAQLRQVLSVRQEAIAGLAGLL